MDVFDAFPEGMTPYTFLELARGGVHGKRIVSSHTSEGLFKLRRGYSRGDGEESRTDNPRLKIRPSEPFVTAGTYKKLIGHGIRHDGVDYTIADITAGDNYHDGVREHYSLILEPADLDEYYGG